LDVEENIVSLCSTCHNHIHYGEGAEELLKKLYKTRKKALASVGIVITEEELLSYYK
jgi:Zn-finger protein